MKKRILNVLLSLLMAGTITFMTSNHIYADDQPYLMKAHATAYCQSGTTASGTQTRKGICAAKKEWIGKTIVIYQRLPGDKIGNMIGIYECLDTGGTEGIKTGKVIDIWEPDLEGCQEFMNKVYENGCKGKVYIQIVDAVG